MHHQALSYPAYPLPAVELERACIEGVEGVVEAAAVACPTPGGGPEQLFLFLVLRPGVAMPVPELQQRCQQAISSRLNPLFRVRMGAGCGILAAGSSVQSLAAVSLLLVGPHKGVSPCPCTSPSAAGAEGTVAGVVASHRQ